MRPDRAADRPALPDATALTIAVGIIGATVMAHAVYLHSGLTRSRPHIRNEGERHKVLRFSDIEMVVALPVPMIARISVTSRGDPMGNHVTRPLPRFAATLGACPVLGLNFVLLAQTFCVPVPFLVG